VGRLEPPGHPRRIDPVRRRDHQLPPVHKLVRPWCAHGANRPSERRGGLPVKWGAKVGELRHMFALMSI
jgi:hypothetical protein